MKADNTFKPIDTVKIHAFNNFDIAEVIYQPNLRMLLHAHKSAHISFILGGSYTENYERRSRFAKSSSLIFHPPGEKHSVVFQGKGAKIFSINIGNEWLDNIRGYSKALDSPHDFNQSKGSLLLTLVSRIYGEFHRMDEFSPLAIEGLILEMVAAISRKASVREQKIPKRLERAKELLHEHFSENLELGEIARTAGVHPAQLAREFRRFYHCTMGEYLRGLRIEAARRQISSSKLSLSEIALNCGFYDQSHFTNVFKELVGMTPSQYKSIFRPN